MLQKDYSISFVRFVAICLIVSCHVAQGLGSALAFYLNIGVQIFLCISGWLHGAKTIEDPLLFWRKRFVRILVPFYFLLAIVLPLFVWRGSSLGIREVVDAVMLRHYPGGLGHLWFVSVILLLYLITPSLHQIKNRIITGSFAGDILRLGALFAGVVVACRCFNLPFHPAFLLCYFAGYFLRVMQETYDDMTFRHFVLVIEIAALVLGTALFILPRSGISPFLKGAVGVGLFAMLYCLYPVIARVVARRVLLFSDRFSYEIYLWHHVFLLGPLAFALSGVGILCALVAGLLSAVCLEFASKHIIAILSSSGGK